MNTVVVGTGDNIGGCDVYLFDVGDRAGRVDRGNMCAAEPASHNDGVDVDNDDDDDDDHDDHDDDDHDHHHRHHEALLPLAVVLFHLQLLFLFLITVSPESSCNLLHRLLLHQPDWRRRARVRARRVRDALGGRCVPK